MKTKFENKAHKIQPLVQNFKQEMQKLYGDNMLQLILFGSYARGNPTTESDIDLLLILKHMNSPYREIEYMSSLTADFTLRYDVFFSVVPTTIEKFQTMPNPLYANIKKEGIVI